MTIRQVAATLALDNGHKYQMELDPSQKLLVDTRAHLEEVTLMWDFNSLINYWQETGIGCVAILQGGGFGRQQWGLGVQG